MVVRKREGDTAKQTEVFVISAVGTQIGDIKSTSLNTRELLIMIRLGESLGVEEHLAVQSLLASLRRLREAVNEE